MRLHSAIFFVAAGLLGAVHGSFSRVAQRYVIVSAPRTSKISYIKIGQFGTAEGEPQTLVNAGLNHPQGLAVDQARAKLYVADPDDSKILSYQLANKDGALVASNPQVVSSTAESRWVTVDSVGNLFFSDEPLNRIIKMTATSMRGGEGKPEVIYDGNVITAVNSPGGIAADNFYVYWTNKQVGDEVGALVRGAETPSKTNQADSVAVMAKNTVKSYGVCIAIDNVFYTDTEKNVYGVKKAGSDIVTVSSELTQPRGCAWDGDGTVYVADRGANKVYSFAGNQDTLSLATLSVTTEFEDAFGVAVWSSAWQALPAAAGLLAALLAW